MSVVMVRYFQLGKTTLTAIAPPPVLSDESPSLCSAFRNALKETPQGFKYKVELEGFAPAELQWSPTCMTAGALLFPSFRANQPLDLIVILLNGVETRQELAVLATQYPLQPHIWSDATNAPKPLALAAANVPGRIREPATVTILNAFANVFFAQFGTNAGNPPR